MKRLFPHIVLLIILLLPAGLRAQQQPLFSQYMFNRLMLNPAYAGSREQMSISLIGRQQWVGLEGAPKTINFGLHSPSMDMRHGFGLNILADEIYVSKRIEPSLSYAYRILTGEKSAFSMGLSIGMALYSVDLSAVPTTTGGDPAFASGSFTKGLPRAGAGLYWTDQRTFVGLSSPNFLPLNNLPSELEGAEGREAVHLFLNAGHVFRLSQNIKLRLSALLRGSEGMIWSADINAGILFAERIWIGGGWRVGDAVNMMTEIRLTRQLRLGYAYDHQINVLNGLQSGSHELRLGFDLDFATSRIDSPRDF